jgi:protein subunit release factor A
LADFFLPKSEAILLISKFIEILTPSSEPGAQGIAQKLRMLKGGEEARLISKKLLEMYPSGMKTNSYLDLRYAGHIFADNNGIASLRCLTGKSYNFLPYEIGRITAQ